MVLKFQVRQKKKKILKPWLLTTLRILVETKLAENVSILMETKKSLHHKEF